MNTVSRRRFLQITGATAGVAAAGRSPAASRAGRRPATGDGEGRPDGPDLLRHLLLEVRRDRPREGRPPLEDRGQPRATRSAAAASARAAPAASARTSTPTGCSAPLIRRQKRGAGGVGRGHLGRGARLRRREDAGDQGRSTAPRRWRSSATASAATSSSTRCKAYGTPNIAAPSFAQCRGPRDVGFRLTFGEDVGSPERTDIRNARCLVLIGSHLGENMHNTQVQEFAEAVGAAPRSSWSIRASRSPPARRSTTCRSSPAPTSRCCSPGCTCIVDEGLYDSEYVDAHGFGFDAVQADDRRVHAGVGLSGDRHRAGGDPRDRARDGALPAGHARPPRAATRPGTATTRSAAARSRC